MLAWMQLEQSGGGQQVGETKNQLSLLKIPSDRNLSSGKKKHGGTRAKEGTGHDQHPYQCDTLTSRRLSHTWFE